MVLFHTGELGKDLYEKVKNVELPEGMKKSVMWNLVEELPKQVEKQVQRPKMRVWLNEK
jgi:hypothetical protein